MGTYTQIFYHFGLPANDPESAMNIDLGFANVTNKFQTVGKFINKKTTSIEDQMYLYYSPFQTRKVRLKEV